MTLWLIALKLNAKIFMRIEISRICHNSFTIAWGNSGTHDFSANTDYQLLYTKKPLYNIPIGEKYFYFEMYMCTLRLNYRTYLDEQDMSMLSCLL